MKLSKIALASLLTAGAGVPAITIADSDIAFGSGASAAADLDFRVVIPQFVYFQVGASAAPGSNDLVDFDLSTGPIQPGDGTDVTDSNDPVDVVLIANAAVTISAEALGGSGPLAAGSAEISASSNNASIPVPSFGASAAQVTGPLINETGEWTFAYDNAAVYAPGTYTDTVTYTAATP